jgi:sugar/nucleoside kinase (ribokinase family)
MYHSAPIEPVDYLIIGHITQDLTPHGPMLGGTVSYASLTAKAMGLRVGIVTSSAPDLTLKELEGIPISSYPSEYTSTFENIYTPDGRIQYIHHRAATITANMVPETWRSAPIVHLGPVDQEIDHGLLRIFPHSIIGLTLQGWLRDWDKQGKIHLSDWPESSFVLQNAHIAVLSLEDVEGDERRIEEMLSSMHILVVTEGKAGARVYWNGDMRRFSPPQVYKGDATGAGDIFAAAFFTRYYQTRDPWEAAHFATLVAACSVTRPGLLGIPTRDEIEQDLTEVIGKS